MDILPPSLNMSSCSPPSLHQGGDSDDEGEGLGPVDDTQPSDEGHLSSQDPDGFATYGENDLVPEPRKVRPITRLLFLFTMETVPHTFTHQQCMFEPAPHTQPPGLGVRFCLGQLVQQGINTAQ